MSWFRCMSFVVALLAAAPAFAQQPQRPPSPARAAQPLRGYLIGGGGASVGTPQTALTLNAEIAENMTRNVQAYMSVGYYDNIMSQAARNQLVQVSSALTALTGNPWAFEGRDRGRSFTFGGKFLVPTGTQARPYIGGGAGVLNVRRHIHEQTRGDITSAYLTQFGSVDGMVEAGEESTNHPMAEAAGGVGVVVGHAYVDFGYRYRRAFHNLNQSFNVSQVGVSAGVKF
jgi:hypothetical protein